MKFTIFAALLNFFTVIWVITSYIVSEKKLKNVKKSMMQEDIQPKLMMHDDRQEIGHLN